MGKTQDKTYRFRMAVVHLKMLSKNHMYNTVYAKENWTGPKQNNIVLIEDIIKKLETKSEEIMWF
jgi:hypothetical protein